MSFASEVKNELARIEEKRPEALLAEIAAFIRMAGSIRLVRRDGTDGGARPMPERSLGISTENPAVARHFKKQVQDYFGVEPVLRVEAAHAPGKGESYAYLLDVASAEKAERILRETGILGVRRGTNFLSDGILPELIRTKTRRKAYLRGLFLAAGTVSDPHRGYHFEIVCSSEVLAGDVLKLMENFVDITPAISVRRGKFPVYLKAGGQIRDVLALMGAGHATLVFDDVLLKKQMMNDTVRLTNCDNANTDRSLAAAEKQLNAVRFLQEAGLLDKLPPKLREAAYLRLENPAASLADLGEMFCPPVKKSGADSRFQKIMRIAQECRQERA